MYSGSFLYLIKLIDELYNEIITVGTHKAPSIKVAEAAKVIENTQRETEYYKKQMDIFKDQMHKANLRDQKTESELCFFKNQVQKYED